MKTIKLTIKSKKINDLIPLLMYVYFIVNSNIDMNLDIEYTDKDVNEQVKQLMEFNFNKQ